MQAGGKASIAAAVAVAAAAIVRAPARQVRRVPTFAAHSVTVVGHRGARGHAPENTVAALREGVRLGAEAVEFDVRLTRDRHAVLLHDPTVDRTTDGSGPVSEHTLADLQRLDAGHRWRDDRGRHVFRGQRLRVPLLSEALAAVPDTFCVIELKADAGVPLVGVVADEVHAAGAAGRVLLASADASQVMAARAALPGTATNLAEIEARTLYGLHCAGLHRRWRPRGRVLQVPEIHEGRRIVTPRLVAAAHDLGLDVQVWTVNDLDDMRRLILWGVDGLITDHPDRAVRVVREVGLATPPRPPLHPAEPEPGGLPADG